MRILHVINSLSGSGGAEQGLVREITRFGPGITQLVVRLYQPNDLESRLTETGIESVCIGLDPGNSGWNWPVGARRLRRLVDTFRPDVIQSSLASANLIAQIASNDTAIPVLSTFTLSGDPKLMRTYQPGADRLRAQILRRIERRWARHPHVWFRALTEDARVTNCEVARLDPARVTVLPRGVPLPGSDRVPTRAELGLPEDVPVILNVGRQTAQKGHDDLIAAFAAVLRRHKAHLVVLGREGDGSETLRTAVERSGVGDQVSVVPYTDRPYDYYRNADVFAFSSHMEGLGTAVLEAMACRLPVVAFDIPPVREVAGDGRFATLVPVGDSDGLGDGIVELLERADRSRQVAELAHANVVASYTLDGVASRLLERLTEISRQATRPLSGR